MTDAAAGVYRSARERGGVAGGGAGARNACARIARPLGDIFERARLWPITSFSPFGACRLPAKAEVGSLLDHLVGGRQQRFRDGKAERLGGFEVDDEIELGRRCTGRSAGFSPLRMRPV